MPANPTSKLCRRLFKDSKPRVFIQQNLDQLIKGEQERFLAKWNFDVNKVSSSNSWKIITDPKASFYVRPPHKLKAKRRLTPSMLESLRSEMQTPRKCLTSSCLFGNIVFNFSSPQVEKMDTMGTAPQSGPAQQSISVISSSVESHFASTSKSPLSADPVFKIPAVPKILKRKSNPRMTDYFAVQKRPRETSSKYHPSVRSTNPNV
ncbi:unnamed protein product [Hymenolepis diminuta]|uniref:CDI domain-containing protein n=2 Tax=Hymenolepis diminuta TaxID=6216 RepID=A0A0R3SDH8_HYMDI|nr:unnamed protein product [Hymenolepis diminuta]